MAESQFGGMGILCFNSSTKSKGLEHGSGDELPSRNLPSMQGWNWESQAQLELKLATVRKGNKSLYKYTGNKKKNEANVGLLLLVE